MVDDKYCSEHPLSKECIKSIGINPETKRLSVVVDPSKVSKEQLPCYIAFKKSMSDYSADWIEETVVEPNEQPGT